MAGKKRFNSPNLLENFLTVRTLGIVPIMFTNTPPTVLYVLLYNFYGLSRTQLQSSVTPPLSGLRATKSELFGARNLVLLIVNKLAF